MTTPKETEQDAEDVDLAPDIEIELDDSEAADDSEAERDVQDLSAPEWMTTTQIVRATRTDFPLSMLAPGIKSGMFDLAPQYQRRDRWTGAKQSRFIESLIIGVPVPPILLREQPGNKFVVIDGRQRLTAVSRFYEDKLRLTYSGGHSS